MMKTYRVWFIISFVIHVALVLGLSMLSVPAKQPPEKIVRVKMVQLPEPPKPVVKPVLEPPKAIPPEPKAKPQPKVKHDVPRPKAVKLAPKPRVEKPKPVVAPQPQPPKPQPVKPKPAPPAPIAAAPKIMRSTKGSPKAPPAPPGKDGGMGTSGQGTVIGPPPPPPPPPGPTYDAGSLGGPSPGYPKEAEEEEWEGSVTVTVHTRPDGDFTASIGRSSGHDVLDKAAMRAIQSWRFKPAMKNGEPIAGSVSVRFTFSGGRVQGVAL